MADADRDAAATDASRPDDTRYRRVFATIDLGVLFHDADGAIVDANPAAERMLGMTLLELRRLGPVRASWPAVPADGDRRGRDEERDAARDDERGGDDGGSDTYPLQEVLRTGRPVRGALLEVRRPTAGRSIWLQADAHLDEGTADGAGPFVVVTLADVTTHREDRKELVRRRSLEALLVEIATTYIDVPPDRLDAAVHDTLERLGRFIGADRFYVFRYDWDANTTTNTHEWCAAGISPEIEQLQGVPLAAIPPWTQTHAAGRTMRVDDVAQLPGDDELRIILEPQGVQSLMAVPIMDGEACVGFVGLDAVRKRRDFRDSEERLLRVFAQMLAGVGRRTPHADRTAGRAAGPRGAG